jgi:hypothetical protein
LEFFGTEVENKLKKELKNRFLNRRLDMEDSDKKIRKCTCTEEARLMPESRELEIYNSVISYQCDTCAKEVKITPLGSIGTLITVGLLAIGIIAYMQLSGVGKPTIWDYAIVGFSIVCLAAITVPPLLTHQRFPVIPSDISVDELPTDDDSSKHMFAKIIVAIEGLGFLFGMLAPILFIAAVLGVATLIGYANYLWFQ